MATEVTPPTTLELVSPHGSKNMVSKADPFSSQDTLRAKQHFETKLQHICKCEGEDAALTGGTRSLHRRLLALNMYGSANVAGVPQSSRPLAANF